MTEDAAPQGRSGGEPAAEGGSDDHKTRGD
jgi:hypothetical protein